MLKAIFYPYGRPAARELIARSERMRRIVRMAQLVDVQGWQVHIETTLTIGIDRSGHIAFSIAYKRGPAAPEFTKVNTFQSGLTIKY